MRVLCRALYPVFFVDIEKLFIVVFIIRIFAMLPLNIFITKLGLQEMRGNLSFYLLLDMFGFFLGFWPEIY